MIYLVLFFDCGHIVTDDGYKIGYIFIFNFQKYPLFLTKFFGIFDLFVNLRGFSPAGAGKTCCEAILM